MQETFTFKEFPISFGFRLIYLIGGTLMVGLGLLTVVRGAIAVIRAVFSDVPLPSF